MSSCFSCTFVCYIGLFSKICTLCFLFQLPGVISVEEAKKRGFAFEDETSKIEDQKEDPKVKSKVVYTKDTSDKK